MTASGDPKRLTYHLTPAEWWAASDPSAPLGAPSLDTDGFIHCTDGGAAMVETANRHYAGDDRAFVILTVDLDRVGSRWSAEDTGRIYPHVFGPLARESIIAVAPAPRGSNGEFLPFAR